MDEGTLNNQEKLTGSFTRYLQNAEDVIALGKMNDDRIVIQYGTYDDNGNKIGIWKTFDEMGELIETSNFSDDDTSTDLKKEYYKNSENLKSTVAYNSQTGNGIRKLYYPNSQLKKLAIYVNQELEGAYEEYYEDGKLKTIGQYIAGVKMGNWKIYTKEGLIKNNLTYTGDCCFAATKLDYYYTREGKLSSTIFQEDKQTNPLNDSESFFGTTLSKDFHENGQLRELEQKKKMAYGRYGLKHGLYPLYYSNGKLEKEGYYKDDEKHGLWSYYDYEGHLKLKKTYNLGNVAGPFEEYTYYYPSNKKRKYSIGIASEDGRTYAVTSYYEDGSLKEERTYDKGKAVGVWKVYNEKGKVIKKQNINRVMCNYKKLDKNSRINIVNLHFNNAYNYEY